jgi:hypothetical protein
MSDIGLATASMIFHKFKRNYPQSDFDPYV